MRKYDRLRDELKKRGYKITRQRSAIFEAFEEENKALLTAQEIFDKARQSNPGTNFSTVYRNLELLLQEGIIKRVDLNRDAAYFGLDQEGEHHHHLICKRCGDIKAMDYCPYKDIFDEDGFVPLEHRFEVYGYCKECAKG